MRTRKPPRPSKNKT